MSGQIERDRSRLGHVNQATVKRQEITATFHASIKKLREDIQKTAIALPSTQSRVNALTEEVIRQGRKPDQATVNELQLKQAQVNALRAEMDRLRTEMAGVVKKRIEDLTAIDEELAALGISTASPDPTYS